MIKKKFVFLIGERKYFHEIVVILHFNSKIG
jgi:hypothetical protein